MTKILVMLCLASTFLTGCPCKEPEAAKKTEVKTEEKYVLKVSALLSGDVLVAGIKVSMTELDARLAEAKSKNGTVWFYRESTADQPNKAATEVFRRIVKQRLPISFSTHKAPPTRENRP